MNNQLTFSQKLVVIFIIAPVAIFLYLKDKALEEIKKHPYSKQARVFNRVIYGINHSIR